MPAQVPSSSNELDELVSFTLFPPSIRDQVSDRGVSYQIYLSDDESIESIKPPEDSPLEGAQDCACE